MGWVVITGDDQCSPTVYASEQDAEDGAREIAECSEEEIWVAIADQSTKETRIISVGSGD